MVIETASKVTSLIEDLQDGQFIDETTMEWLLQTPKPLRVPEFYTLTKIHKPKPLGRPIISGCDSPTERISAFVDRRIQPIAKIQNSYIKDSHFQSSFIPTPQQNDRDYSKSLTTCHNRSLSVKFYTHPSTK